VKITTCRVIWSFFVLASSTGHTLRRIAQLMLAYPRRYVLAAQIAIAEMLGRDDALIAATGNWIYELDL
jgi:hypothetical protein